MIERLYHEALLALARDDAHAGRLDGPGGTATLSNPLCGDRVTIDMALDGRRVLTVAHRVRGCVLCQAAAAAISATLPGFDAAELATVEDKVRDMLAGRAAPPEAPWQAFAHFRPASAYKSRHECVLLPFEAAAAALADAAS